MMGACYELTEPYGTHELKMISSNPKEVTVLEVHSILLLSIENMS
jgi:hypothetical protein